MTVPRFHIYRIRTNRQVVSQPQYGAGPRLRNDEPTTRDHAIDAILSCVWMLRLDQPDGLCSPSDSQQAYDFVLSAVEMTLFRSASVDISQSKYDGCTLLSRKYGIE
jgi:hypothetical protein